jgi:FdhD protein
MVKVINIQKLNVCEEFPVDLNVNAKKVVTFMCTPCDLNELAIGHLYSNGMIDGMEEIYTLAACDDMRKIYIKAKKDIVDGFQLNTVLASSCGSGAQFTEKFYEKPVNESSFKVTMIKIIQMAKEMFSKAELYKKFGGMHCAALSDGNNILALREDVGRHNAVDKVIGKGVFLGTDFNNSMIMTTGRISTDMILKAVNIGCPVIISRSIPTTLALEIAEKFGITIVGRVISSKPIIYTNKDRIVNEESYMDENLLNIN